MKSSVVITTHKRGEQLYRCLGSMFSGTRKPDEIIIVDDGPGGDITPQVARSYADQYWDTPIAYVVRDRRHSPGWSNPAIPRNMGIRLTDPAHEVIILSEPEMLFAPDTIEILMAFFENPPKEYVREHDKPWLPLEPVPERFFLTASYIGYEMKQGVSGGEAWKDFNGVFGHKDVDRRWPEFNTRVGAALRSDVFEVRGWDEANVGWGYDDTSFMARLDLIGVKQVPLRIPVVHMWHEYPPAGGPEADNNLRRMQSLVEQRIHAPNGPDWGRLPRNEVFGTSISEEMWAEIQRAELQSWTTGAWPSVQGKLHRERRYLKQALADLEIEQYAQVEPGQLPQRWLDVGCGPHSILELASSLVNGVASDSLHEGYENAGLRLSPDIEYVWARAEDLAVLVDRYGGDFDGLTSVNGIDHYQDPRKALQQMAAVVRVGGLVCLHFCINNASEGHPHPAHRIDLHPDHIRAWAAEDGGRLELVSEKVVPYGWRHQDAAAMVLRRVA